MTKCENGGGADVGSNARPMWREMVTNQESGTERGGRSKSTGKEYDWIETVRSWEVMVYDADNNVGTEGCLEEGVIHEVVEQIPNLAVAQVVTWVDLRGKTVRKAREWSLDRRTE